MVGPSWVCGGGAGGLSSVKAIQSGGSQPCVVNESSRVESSRTCLPEGSPFRAQGNNKPKLISTLTTSASQIQ